MSRSRGARLLGVGESDITTSGAPSTLALIREAVDRAAADAGIDVGAIDGLLVSKSGELRPGDLPAAELAEALAVRPRFIDTTISGGCAPVIQLTRAIAAVSAGLCSYALVAYGSTQASRRLRKRDAAANVDLPWPSSLERSTGYLYPISVHGLIAQRHMYQYGTTPEQLASVAVSDREWARLNPAALKREALTIDDVLSSPMVSSPLHVLDCCLITDGAGAIIVGPAEAARSTRPSVELLGFAERHSHLSLLNMDDLTTSAAVDTGARALAMAGLAPSDIDCLQLYDAFTDSPILLLEDLGFCEKGEGGPMVESGVTRPGGRLPMNTQGGGLSHCHPGMYGIFLLIEAFRQLSREAGARQVPNVDTALCHGVGGGSFGSHATVVLGTAS